MADTQKDTIYVDVDDEITSVIEKLRDAKHKIVALVLPKRATMLQSIVNMKLFENIFLCIKSSYILVTGKPDILCAVFQHIKIRFGSKPICLPVQYGSAIMIIKSH